MNDATAVIELGRRIDLTREPDISIGGVEIRPTACEIVVGGGRIRLQPRVMQVLVALARAGGRTVSREALIQVCWAQAAVGDDSLYRCIQRLRRLADTEVGGVFAIETIPRLGYRLTPNPGCARGAGGAKLAGRRSRAPLIAAGCLAVVAAIAAAALATWNTRPVRWSVERSERLVSTPLVERHPAISPDGTMLAYSAGPDIVSRHIYLKRLSGGEAIQLSDDPWDDVSPAWSPDSARIAYVANRAGEPCRIMVIATPAGFPTEVGRCKNEDRSKVVWTPQGKSLLFVDAATPVTSDQIMRLDLATGRREAISHPLAGYDDIEPAVSPDGRWVLFLRASGQAAALAMIHDLTSGREKVIARIAPVAGAGAWSDDSKALFIAEGNLGGSSIWAYPIKGGSRALVASLPLGVGRLASGRGGLLAAEIFTGRFDVVRPPGVRETAPVVVDPANGETWAPAYSPDGSLAVASNRSGDNGIWLTRPGARARPLLSAGNDHVAFPAWSPDGAELAIVAAAGETLSVHVVGLNGQGLARIPVAGSRAGRPAWSGDGGALLFPVRDGRGWRLWRADLSRPGKPYPITGYGWAAVRTSGEAIYAARDGAPGLWRLGPDPRRIVAGFSSQLPESWTIFKNQIVFADNSDTDRPRLLAVSTSGGTPRPFAQMPRPEYHLDFAIDPRSGTTVYIGVISSDSDIELFHLARR